MNNWNLEKLYENFEDENFCNDTKKLNEYVEKINDFILSDHIKTVQSSEIIENYLKLYIKSQIIMDKLKAFVMLKQSENNMMNLSEYRALINNAGSKLIACKSVFEEYIKNIENISEITNKTEFLSEHSYYIEKIFNNIKFSLTQGEEAILSDMKKTGSASWNRLRSKLLNQVMNEYNESGNIDVFKKIEDLSSMVLNSVKGEALTIAKARGYNSPLDMSLRLDEIDKRVLDLVIECIENNKFKLQKFYEIKRKLLKKDTALEYNQRSIPIEINSKKYTIEEAKCIILRAFKDFDNELYEFAKNAFDRNWIDFEPNKSKSSGGFCTSIYSIKESRILVNFKGDMSDILMIAHEIGHAFHNHLVFRESYLNINYPMPAAETASTICEIIVKKNLLKLSSDDEKVSLLNAAISGELEVTVDILSRFYFEDSFFNLRRIKELSSDEINEIMINSQKKCYGSSLDNQKLNPYIWIIKPHFYSSEMNYYNYQYAVGLLLALGLYSKHEQEGNLFIEKYRLFLQKSGKYSVEQICKFVDIDIYSKEFWQSSVDIILKNINMFEKYSENYINKISHSL